MFYYLQQTKNFVQKYNLTQFHDSIIEITVILSKTSSINLKRQNLHLYDVIFFFQAGPDFLCETLSQNPVNRIRPSRIRDCTYAVNDHYYRARTGKTFL